MKRLVVVVTVSKGERRDGIVIKTEMMAKKVVTKKGSTKLETYIPSEKCLLDHSHPRDRRPEKRREKNS